MTIVEITGGCAQSHRPFTARARRARFKLVRHALPTIFPFRDFTEAGGMMSYGSGFDDFRQVGIYTGRILKGAKPRPSEIACLPGQWASMRS